MVRLTASIALALLLLPTSVLADSHEDDAGVEATDERPDRTSLYLELGGLGGFNVRMSEFPFDHSGGLLGAAGLRFGKNGRWAVELFGDWLAARDDDTGSQFSIGLKTKRSFVVGPVEPYLTAGGGLLWISRPDDARSWGGQIQAGLGLDYFFNEKWALNVESLYRNGTGSFKGLGYVDVIVGFQRHFK